MSQTTYDADTMSTTTVALSDNVATGGLTFEYYQSGANPADAGVEPLDPASDNINNEAGMVRITLVMEKGTMQRTFYQDIFLRAINRSPEGYYCVINKVTPASLPRGASNQLVTIEGSNTHFIEATSVAVFSGIDVEVIVGSTHRVDDETATCRVNIPAGAALESGDVTVVTGGEYPDALVDGLRLLPDLRLGERPGRKNGPKR